MIETMRHGFQPEPIPAHCISGVSAHTPVIDSPFEVRLAAPVSGPRRGRRETLLQTAGGSDRHRVLVPTGLLQYLQDQVLAGALTTGTTG